MSTLVDQTWMDLLHGGRSTEEWFSGRSKAGNIGDDTRKRDVGQWRAGAVVLFEDDVSTTDAKLEPSLDENNIKRLNRLSVVQISKVLGTLFLLFFR